MGVQSYRTFVYEENQTSPVSIFPLNFNKSGNAIESFNYTSLQMQLSFYYSIF